MPDTSTHITTSGGLFTTAFLDTMRRLNTNQPGTAPDTFTLPGRDAPHTPAGLEDTIATAWDLLCERWDAVRADLPTMSVGDLRTRWLLPLFHLLDFDPTYLRGDTVLDDVEGLRFNLSHRGWDPHRGWEGEGDGNPAPVLHTVPPEQDLDTRPGTTAPARSPKAKSPHDMLQLFLNLSRADRWALLSNGVLLRVLRDYHHTFSKGYVQFDLEAIFETRNYADFRALYRLCHASRFIAPGADALPPLETLYKTAIATGVKVGEDLRGQVRAAIEILGNGLLHHHGPTRRDGPPLHTRLQDDPDLCQQYYGEILRVIYRILFLLFAEQRGLLPHSGAPLEDLYHGQYAITALRERAEGDLPRYDSVQPFTDLWEGLQVTFRMVKEGAPDLGVFGYNGMLFSDDPAGALLPGRACPNSALLRALRALTLIQREGALQRISYVDLGVEELGAIYESLLDYTPRVTAAAEEVDGREIPANTFFLDPRGLARKSSGSYYTHPSLVDELIQSALLPVLRDRLARAGLPVIAADEIGEATAALLVDYAGLDATARAAGAAALLDLTVCDPAAGSGHFLVKANDVLGAELARLRSGDEYPTEAQIQAAKRDVLARCIYAVDLNPMAVELCKVSLWINASVADRPLSFLDHHIKVGNSLVGATPALLKEGVPYDAFALGRPGDDRELAKQFRKQNRQERRDYEKSGGLYQPRFRVVAVLETEEDVREWFGQLEELADVAPNQAREQYAQYIAGDDYRRRRLEADLWTVAFFWPMPAGTQWAPTFAELTRFRTEGPEALPPERLAQVTALAEEHRFFHWHLEFPDVFAERETPSGLRDPKGLGWAGGFDVVLGNPPWETLELKEKEFFADKAPTIADARTAAKRRKLIKQLSETNPDLHQAYLDALHLSEATKEFFRNSGRYPLSAVGKLNTYQIFAGLVRQLVDEAGRVGVIVPSGIATDYYNQDYFNAIVQQRELVSLYDFENKERLFPEVAPVVKFTLLTLTGPREEEREIAFAFFLTQTEQLADPERTYTLTPTELLEINPNTGTCPTFRTRTDADLTKKLYCAAPVLVNETTAENPWDVSFKQGLFNMASDSHLFNEDPGEERLRLYEAKLVQQYDHRHGTFEGTSEESRYKVKASTTTPTLQQLQDGNFVSIPRYWIGEKDVDDAIPSHWKYGWFIVFRDIIQLMTNARCSIFTVIPKVGIGHTLSVVLSSKTAPLLSAFVACFNSFVLDFVTRQKMGGSHLSFYIVEQLPVLSPDIYTPGRVAFIVPRVLELTYTAWDLKPFADDVWAEANPPLRAAIKAQWQANAAATDGGHRHATPPHPHTPSPAHPFPHPPFMWDDERRLHLRCQLDALYAHLYGLSHDELAYILDTFPIVRRKDKEKYGHYRTKRLILDYFGIQEWTEQ